VADLPIDAVAYALEYLRQRDDVLEAVADRVSSRLAPDFPLSGPSLRVELVNLDLSARHGKNQRAHLQVTGYAGGPNLEPDAFRVTATAFAAFLELPALRPVFAGVVASATDATLGISTALDDPTLTSGYRFGMVLTLHRQSL
jgi:hypothetical protein